MFINTMYISLRMRDLLKIISTLLILIWIHWPVGVLGTGRWVVVAAGKTPDTNGLYKNFYSSLNCKGLMLMLMAH